MSYAIRQARNLAGNNPLATLADHYAAKLRQCFPPNPSSFALARTIHAHMITSGFNPRGHFLSRLVDIYCQSNNIDYARQLFDKIPEPDIVTRTTMVSGYCSFGNVKDARLIFDETPLCIRDIVCYNAMITGYCRNDDGRGSVELFKEMLGNGFRPDHFSFSGVLSGLSLVADDERVCYQLLCAVVKSGMGSFTSVLNALLLVYMKCALSPFVESCMLLGEGRVLFDEMQEKDETSWTTMITGYVRNDDLNSAREVFDSTNEKSVGVWNAMISGYVHHGLYLEALELLSTMSSEGIQPDEYTYTNVLGVCADYGLFSQGKEIHARIFRKEANCSPQFSSSINNGLVTLYSKCGKINEARHIFEEMNERVIVSWNAILSAYVNTGQISNAIEFFLKIPQKTLLTWAVMIAGYAQNGLAEEGLKLLNQMRIDGFQPCDYAFAGAITACSNLGALQQGKQIHAMIINLGYESTLSTANALITMYGRCGVLEDAHLIFLTLCSLDSISWNAIISAFGQHGCGNRALELFEEMLELGMKPDRITFLNILTACTHSGLVDEGYRYFKSMHSYDVSPGEDHFTRMIDLYCRSGKFSEAQQLVEKMPFEPKAPIWEAFLAGCRVHGKLDLGIEVSKRLLDLAPQHDGTYVLLSNMYAQAGKWEEVAKVRMLMRERGVKKEQACSWIGVENKTHVFFVDDICHPEIEEVYDYLAKLAPRLREFGYVPDTMFVLHDVELEQKEYSLSTHSEKLAVAYGLLRLPIGATVRVFKNLRICGDCHNAIKYVSKVVNREIVVRDGKRFHHFRNGQCSCHDFW